MKLLRTAAEMRSYRRDVAKAGGRVGFVPTMGALHAGHGALLKAMAEECSAPADARVLSIFVNPTQFAPTEDLARYPRTLDQDLELARSAGVTAAFAPSAEEMYPPGFSTFVEETEQSQGLCGEFRPGHFRGVATVVLKLFHLVEPRVAYFGMKDAQQFYVIGRMVRDLGLAVDLRGVETVREPDGLALSSRNRALSPPERERAPLLYRALRDAASAICAGAAADRALSAARGRLEQAGFRMQYVEIRTFEPGKARILAAAYLGTTRLIDNVIVN